MNRRRSLFATVLEREASHPVVRLWERARAKAMSRRQLPVGVVQSLGYGRLFVVQESDVAALAEQLDESQTA